MTSTVYVEVQTVKRDHGAQIGLQAFTHGFKGDTGKPLASVPYKADRLQGGWLPELLDHKQPSVIHPRRTNALHTVALRYLGVAGLFGL